MHPMHITINAPRIVCLLMSSTIFLSVNAQDDIFLSLQNRDLVKVATRTCAVEVIGNTGEQMFDTAINPIDLKMYGMSAAYNLYEIDIEGASLRFVGSTDRFVNALAFSG